MLFQHGLLSVVSYVSLTYDNDVEVIGRNVQKL
jgi:hypothetical protein